VAAYEKFVHESMEGEPIWRHLNRQVFLGDEPQPNRWIRLRKPTRIEIPPYGRHGPPVSTAIRRLPLTSEFISPRSDESSAGPSICPNATMLDLTLAARPDPGRSLECMTLAALYELAQRASSDESDRNAWIATAGDDKAAAGNEVVAVDGDNLSWLKALVQRQGFPTVEQVGRKGVNDAWLPVQHADRDPAFQAQVLDVPKPRLASGGVRKQDFAMLLDRVRRAQDKPQIYGSQFMPNKRGRLVPEPTEDMAHVDERRAAMNLMPLAAYSCVLRFSMVPASPAAH
jgi:hypothetical protein